MVVISSYGHDEPELLLIYLLHLTHPLVVGTEHYEVAHGVQQILQRFQELQDIIAILGMDELGEEDNGSTAG